MNIIIFGPPGGGKGTQSNNIVNDFDLKQISTGSLLRNEIKLQTELGKKVESQIIAGELVSDKIVNMLIEKIIFGSKNFNKIIFDGYPRTLQQAQVLDKLLEKFNQKISIVLNLNVDKNIHGDVDKLTDTKTEYSIPIVSNEIFISGLGTFKCNNGYYEIFSRNTDDRKIFSINFRDGDPINKQESDVLIKKAKKHFEQLESGE